MPRTIPLRLRAEFSLLQLHTEASLADARRQYRELAKRYHPVAGGDHTDFLALQQAYEQVVGTASKQSLENFQKAGESFEKAMQQGREQWEEAARRTAHSTKKPGK